MELNEFIKQTIIQVTDGIMEGHKYIDDNKYGSGVNDGNNEINFDIAVTSNEESTTGVDGKLSVANILSFGGKDEISNAAVNSNRVQFKIYVHLNPRKNNFK